MPSSNIISQINEKGLRNSFFEMLSSKRSFLHSVCMLPTVSSITYAVFSEKFSTRIPVIIILRQDTRMKTPRFADFSFLNKLCFRKDHYLSYHIGTMELAALRKLPVRCFSSIQQVIYELWRMAAAEANERDTLFSQTVGFLVLREFVFFLVGRIF